MELKISELTRVAEESSAPTVFFISIKQKIEDVVADYSTIHEELEARCAPVNFFRSVGIAGRLGTILADL